MNIEELAFKDRKNLAQLTELDLLDIIEFLQFDRKQWINQFSKTHNESIDIQKENKQLKDNWNKLKELFDIQKGSEEYEALQWLEFQTTNYKNDSIILHFYRILNNFILKLQLENKKFKKLKNNWDELKKYLHNVDVVVDYSENYDGHFINCDELIDKMQELEQGRDSNVKD